MEFSNTGVFISKARLVHGDKYDYSMVNYVRAIKKVIIICKDHGEFTQQPNNHLTGNGCRKCSIIASAEQRVNDVSYFIDKSNRLHKNKFDYSLVVRGGNDIPVKIICPEHGVFEQAPKHHLLGKGCMKCGRFSCKNKQRSNIDKWILRAKNTHGDRYDYSKSVYVQKGVKINIVCKIHGLFSQYANNHLNGNGCPVCAKIVQQTGYYKYSKLNNDASKIPCSLYLIRIYNDSESFYKVGISTNVKHRFNEIKAIYSKEILFLKSSSLKNAISVEQLVLNKLKSNQYNPKIHFDGKSECLDFNPIQFLNHYTKKWK
jgi:hypothetical protein